MCIRDRPLPLQEFLNLVGVTYMEMREQEEITLGGIRMGIDEAAGRFKVSNTLRANALGKELGYRRGDRILSLNGQDLTLENGKDVLQQYRESTEVGDKVTVVIQREDKNGNWKQKKLKGKAIKVKKKEKNVMEINPAASARQAQLFKAWLQLK